MGSEKLTEWKYEMQKHNMNGISKYGSSCPVCSHCTCIHLPLTNEARVISQHICHSKLRFWWLTASRSSKHLHSFCDKSKYALHGLKLIPMNGTGETFRFLLLARVVFGSNLSYFLRKKGGFHFRCGFCGKNVLENSSRFERLSLARLHSNTANIDMLQVYFVVDGSLNSRGKRLKWLLR